MMQTTAPSARELESLAPRVAAIEQETQALAQSLSASRRTRLLLILLVVGFLIITCWSFYRMFARLAEPEQLQVLRSTAEQKLHDRSDLLAHEAQTLVSSAGPVLSAAFAEQFKKDLPGYMQAIGSERDALVGNLQTKLQTRLEDKHAELIERHQKLLREEFPAIEDEKLHAAMMANLQTAVDRLVRKYYVEEMRNQWQTMYDLWDEFPMAPAAEKDDLPIADQIYGNLLELLQVKLSKSPAAAAAEQ